MDLCAMKKSLIGGCEMPEVKKSDYLLKKVFLCVII